MITLVTIIHVMAALVLIISILLQSGKGGGMGAAFGGASQTFFGGHGAGGFLAKITSGMAITFMITSMTLSMAGTQTDSVLGEKARPPVATEAATMEGTQATTDALPKVPSTDAHSDAAPVTK